MSVAPYREAHRVFWIVDNGSSHRGSRAVERLQRRYPNLVLIHGPVHASWLNQIEIYFSIVQRKVVTPNDFRSLAAVEDRLLAFQQYYEALARPFEWTFTRRDWPNCSKAQASVVPPGGGRIGTGYVCEFLKRVLRSEADDSRAVSQSVFAIASSCASGWEDNLVSFVVAPVRYRPRTRQR
jgi:hypothetical protein